MCENFDIGCGNIAIKNNKCERCIKLDEVMKINNMIKKITKKCNKCHRIKYISEFINEQRNEEIKKCYKCREPGRKSEKQPKRKKRDRFDIKRIIKQNYIKNAKKKHIKWNLHIDKAVKLIKEKCFYCNLMTDGKPFSGIDRVFSDLYYEENNCVSCCSMCNFMKGCLDPDIFIERCEHILTYQKIINVKLNYDLFPDKINVSNNRCIRDAKRRTKKFELNPDEYNKIVSHDCYICGKKNTKTHKNGIDRYNNKEGYIIDNCRSCCGECNSMKKNYDFDKLINKLKQIYEFHKNDTEMKFKRKNKIKCIECKNKIC
jgi:hypothetical protein